MSDLRFRPGAPRAAFAAEEVVPPAARWKQEVTRLALCLAAVAGIGVAFAVVAALLPAPPGPARPPFGAGMREAVPAATGLGGYILALQASFSQALRAALSALKNGRADIWPLISLGFAYGVFHAAGPGHGKAIISAYLASSRSALRRGLALSVAAAFIQACVALLLVGSVFVVLKGTAATMSATTLLVERASFLAMAALGAVLLWRKAGLLAGRTALQDCGCGPSSCLHRTFGAFAQRRTERRELAGIALAAGLRPCAGALILLTFALSQGLVGAGIAAVFAMAAGTAVTTGAIAAFTVGAKGLVVGLLGRRAETAWRAVTAIELIAAAAIFVLGLALLAGLWTGDTVL